MNVGLIDTGLKRVHRRVLNDGIFFISSKTTSKNVLGVIEQSFNDHASLINESLTKNANQCFFIKYNDDEDYHTIMALHSHQFIGVEPKEDGNYDFSLICQTVKNDNYLIQWRINLCDDSYFIIQLKDTDFVFEFQKDLNIPVLKEKSDTDIQKFSIKTIRTVNPGIYKINLQFEPKLFLSLPKNSKDATAGENKNNDNQIFFVSYDSNDGCYSIVNLETINCLTSSNESKEKSYVSQTFFFGVDFQRWIIGTYNSKNSDYFIELKSNLLRLGVGEKINFQFIPLILEKFNKKQPIKKNQFFNFKQSKYSNLKECKKHQGIVEEGTEFRYKKEFNLPKELQYNQWVIFESCHFLTKLKLPLSVHLIPENAFVDLRRIKIIDCDPKWIKLFPNPLNIENVIVPQGVEVIEKDSFKDLQNLKVLSLPASLKVENFDLDVFKDFYELRRFEGNPIFLKYIHKSSLELVFIPSWVEEIPEEAFIGCKYLTEIKIEENSKLKIIKARAFANCHSLQSFKVPESVTNIAPSAFDGCNELLKPELTNEQQRFSLVESLVIEPELTKITENYKKFCNIQSLEIPLTTTECDPNILNSFEHLSFVKCNPKWLNSFNAGKIQAVFIPEGIIQIDKNDFENLIHLKFLEIPTSVEFIEENTFSACNELASVKCRLKHLQFLNQKQIKELILNDDVTKLYRNTFERFINLESIELPETIEYIGPNTFIQCKKLVNINNELAEKLINNKVSINDSQKIIIKEEFEGWTNLLFLEIPDSIEEIGEGAFDECINLEHIKCDPKWFTFMPKNSIREITIPDFVKELNSGEFDGFYSLTKLELPKNIKINDPNIFDSCESLIIIKCENSLFKSLSKKTRKRCAERKVLKYVKPVYDFQPDKTKVHDETVNISKNSKNDDDDDIQEKKGEYKLGEEIDFDDLIKYDERFEQYREFIDKVYRIQDGELPKERKPINTSMDEIAKVCGIVCNRIKKEYKIIARPVQILAILCLCDEILNHKESHGAIAEIKTGEGKTIIISILSIVLVEYNRKIDIVTSNLELAKRDQKEQSKYFSLFGIITGVLYQVERDQEFVTTSMKKYVDESKNDVYRNFNIKVLNNPVVYSTSSNYEFVYLYSLFNLSSRKREFDVVLIDEVDNMFIDQSNSPAVIARDINYAYSRDILEIVFHLHYWKTSEIIKTLKYYLPNAGEFKEKDIELLKNAALNAINKIKDIDYIIENNDIVIIDQVTGFKKKGVHWSGFVHEMAQIKEGIEISESSQSFCQITNHAYFNFYKKIAGVTGTIGSIGDAELLQNGYKVDIFKFPRHYISQMEVYLKKRPDATKLYDHVAREIKKVVSKGRPVLVIWDSIYHADRFLESKPNFRNVQKITAVDPSSDRESIKNAGNLETITIATSAAGRGVDIKLSQESLSVGGLHVIIPNRMRNQRSLEQAVGRAGRQGQPGSVTIFISENDQYEKVHRFKKRDENLVKIEHKFWNYLKNNFSWIFKGPLMYGLPSMPVFPYSCDYSVIMNILARMIAFTIYKNPIAMGLKHKLICEIFQDLCMYMISTAWGNFFNALYDDDSKQTDDIDYCNQSYEHFLNEFHKWFHPEKCTSVLSAMLYMKVKLIKEMDMEYIIVNGIKITSFVASVVFPEAAPKIELLGGIVLNGGLEVYHKLQNGDKVNWAQVLICAGGHAIKSLIKQKCGIKDPRKSFGIDISVDIAESLLYNLADSLVVNETKKPKFPPLPTSIKAIAIGTEKWIICLIKEKLKIQPNKPKKISNFKPKCIIPQLKASFIRKTMKIASEAYDGKFSTGEVIVSSGINEQYKPKYYCLEDSDDLYVAVRGTDSFFDIETDGSFAEVKETINGKDIYFHIGFYKAAKYILENVIHLFTQKHYENIYFVGHSYGASVSSVLCLLTKSQDNFKDKNIYSMSFAPAPSMSECPSNIASCIFAFIHHNDFVPHFSGLNFINTISIYGHKIIQRFEKILTFAKNENLKKLIKFVIKNTDAIIETSELLHVRKVKGTIFAIGLTDATSLNDCRIVEYDLPNTLILEISSFNDHRMVNYIEVFDKFDY